MPTYVYQRKDGSTFEQVQSIKDDALRTCPETKQPVKRVIQPVATTFAHRDKSGIKSR